MTRNAENHENSQPAVSELPPYFTISANNTADLILMKLSDLWLHRNVKMDGKYIIYYTLLDFQVRKCMQGAYLGGEGAGYQRKWPNCKIQFKMTQSHKFHMNRSSFGHILLWKHDKYVLINVKGVQTCILKEMLFHICEFIPDFWRNGVPYLVAPPPCPPW